MKTYTRKELENSLAQTGKEIPIEYESFYLNQSEIYVPPKDDIAAIKVVDDFDGKDIERVAVLYKLKTDGNSPFFHGTKNEYLRLVEALNKNHWQKKNTTEHLLADFVGLAKPGTTVEDLKTFIQTWGPLWICQKHNVRGALPCVWSPVLPQINDPDRIGLIPHERESLKPDLPDLCEWWPYEFCDIYANAARTINLILKISQRLLNQAESRNVWLELYKMLSDVEAIDIEHLINQYVPERISEQRLLLEKAINWILRRYKANNAILHWEFSKRPLIRFNSGWGFFPAMLMELSGLITSGYAIRQCEICGKWIMPGDRKRKPKEGQRVFCDVCRRNRATLSPYHQKKKQK